MTDILYDLFYNEDHLQFSIYIFFIFSDIIIYLINTINVVDLTEVEFNY